MYLIPFLKIKNLLLILMNFIPKYMIFPKYEFHSYIQKLFLIYFNIPKIFLKIMKIIPKISKNS